MPRENAQKTTTSLLTDRCRLLSAMFLPHRQAGQPALRLAGLPAYAAKTPYLRA
jgi:hypothetical protein